MNSALIFLDTETTGLSMEDDIWEVFAIRREVDGAETEYHWLIDHDSRKAGALPEPFLSDYRSRFNPAVSLSKFQFAAMFAGVVGDDRPHIVGANPAFDVYRIEILFGTCDVAARWHYHLIDVEPLMLGYLSAKAYFDGATREPYPEIPYRSDDLSRRLGIEPPDKTRHTAEGDVRWVREIFDWIYQ